VASHLLVGNLFLATLAVIALGLHERVRPGRRAELGAGARALATLPVVLLPVQLVLGGLVAGTGAGLVCPSFPSCAGGAWFPSFDGLLGLQVAHRLVAWLLLISAISALVAVARDPVARPRAFLLVGAVLLQGMIGAANVLLRLPVEVTLAHTAGAALLVLVATWHAHGLAWAHVRDAIAARAGEAA
jgi:cytochrome c oxidase assembly protein subunit 15